MGSLKLELWSSVLPKHSVLLKIMTNIAGAPALIFGLRAQIVFRKTTNFQPFKCRC